MEINNDNDTENEHISTFRFINESFDKMIDSTSTDVKEEQQTIYDLLFSTYSIIEKNNVLFIKGSIGYRYDEKEANFIYDMNENKIYITSSYRLMAHQLEYELYKGTYEMCYDKVWTHNDNYILEEKTLSEKYVEIDEDSVPYYRFPRTKDGCSISRVIYNVFKVFRDEKAVKPKIIIPNYHNVYNQIRKDD